MHKYNIDKVNEVIAQYKFVQLYHKLRLAHDTPSKKKSLKYKLVDYINSIDDID